jgi:hypothetical protein
MKSPQDTPSRSLLAVPVAAAASLAALFALAQDPTPAAPAAGADSAPADAVQEDTPDVPLEDYEASEQISEDLSVSFPVDI